jgi:hypothetical protein
MSGTIPAAWMAELSAYVSQKSSIAAELSLSIQSKGTGVENEEPPPEALPGSLLMF